MIDNIFLILSHINSSLTIHIWQQSDSVAHRVFFYRFQTEEIANYIKRVVKHRAK